MNYFTPTYFNQIEFDTDVDNFDKAYDKKLTSKEGFLNLILKITNLKFKNGKKSLLKNVLFINPLNIQST